MKRHNTAAIKLGLELPTDTQNQLGDLLALEAFFPNPDDGWFGSARDSKQRVKIGVQSNNDSILTQGMSDNLGIRGFGHSNISDVNRTSFES